MSTQEAFGLNFILVCIKNSHKTKSEWVNSLQTTSEQNRVEIKERRFKATKTYTYCFVNEVPRQNSNDALNVYLSELTETQEKGKVIYQNSFVTNHFKLAKMWLKLLKRDVPASKLFTTTITFLKLSAITLNITDVMERNICHLYADFKSVGILSPDVMEMMDSKYQRIKKS